MNIVETKKTLLLISIGLILNAGLFTGAGILTLLGAPGEFVSGWAIIAAYIFAAYIFYACAKLM